MPRILITDAYTMGGLSAIRSLGRAGYHTIAAYPENDFVPASLFSRYCSQKCTHPDAWQKPREFASWVLAWAESGGCDAILPTSEGATHVLNAIRDQIPPRVVPLMPRQAELKYCLSKYRATQKAMECLIPCPRTVFVSDGLGGRGPDWNELARDMAGLGLPLVVKVDNHPGQEATYQKGHTFVAPSLDHALAHLRQWLPSGASIIVQEFVSGLGASSFFVRHHGEIKLSYSHESLREFPHQGGDTSYAVSTRDETLLNSGRHLLAAIDFQGVAMVEFRRRAEDSSPLFMEINGRLWASLPVALHAGADFPKVLADSFLGRGQEQTMRPYRTNVRCMNIFPNEIRHVSSVLQNEGGKERLPLSLKLRTILGSMGLILNPFVRHMGFWWSDPLPGLVRAARITKHYLVRLGGYLGRALQLRKPRP